MNLQNSIAEELKDKIIGGEFPPGSQLPTLTEIQNIYGVSRLTVQKALDRLHQDGYSIGKGRHGSFVTEKPPHLYRCGFIFPTGPDSESYYQRALNQSALAACEETGMEPVFYFNLQAPRDLEPFNAAKEDIERRRLAGLVFCGSPENFYDSRLTLNQVPKVAISGESKENIPVLSFNWDGVFEKAFSFFKSESRKRVAVLVASEVQWSPDELFEKLMLMTQKESLELKRPWVQAVDKKHPYWSKPLLELMFDKASGTEVPNSLLILEDHIVEGVTKAISELGIKAPEELSVVAHGNFPSPSPSRITATRIGYDCKLIMDKCLELLKRQKSGLKVPNITEIPAIQDNT